MIVRRRLLRSTLCLLAATALWAHGTASLGQGASEGQLKAAYLVNFLKYIDWPAERQTATICVFGRDSLLSYLAAHEGRLIGGRELHIRQVSTADQLAECQEIFIPVSEEARYATLLRWAERYPVLSVSDNESFTREGGGIALIRSEGRLQFDINTEALNRSGLRPSSQLMRLARQVIGGPR